MQLQTLFPTGRYGYDNRFFVVDVNGTAQTVATLSGSTWSLTTTGETLKAANVAALAEGLATNKGTAGTSVTAVEYGLTDVVHKTVLTLTAVAQTITNTTAEYAGSLIYTFPQGRILFLGVTGTIQQTTTSVIATSISSGATGAWALGRATASSTSLTGTMVDLLPSTAYTSSATINVAAAASNGALVASAQFDGTGTPIPMYLNTAIATGSIDGTQTLSGTITIAWINLGDY
jgi:hypothetical protein